MKEIASRAPEVAILENKLDKMQSLTPRMHNAVYGIHDLLTTPVIHQVAYPVY